MARIVRALGSVIWSSWFVAARLRGLHRVKAEGSVRHSLPRDGVLPGAPERRETVGRARFFSGRGRAYTQPPCPVALVAGGTTSRFSSVGQSDSLVMNRSSVRFR